MAKHNHKQAGAQGHAQGYEGEADAKKFHKDWRVWLVVGMMLAAMLTYVLTLDDSILPSIMRQ
jgi:hypothetical protein